MSETAPVPEPPGLPFLGNITEIDQEFPLGSMIALADKYGEIYRLRFPGRSIVMVSTRALVNETCDEKRFKKSVNRALSQIRNGVHDGLFTARMGEENWGIAHRVLMPAFGPLSIRSMFDEMHDIASQLALKWARYGPESQITVTDDFTRLALDTLALCSMGFRFNSYYSPVLHPFIEAMGDFLVEAGNMSRRLPLPSFVYSAKDQKFASDIEILRGTAREVLESRKAGKTSDRRDLLTAMLEGVDPKTGKKMTDESIMDNLITFLIAGHETTSGLLSFAFYQLLKHPDAYQKAQQEVDGVVGKGQIKVDHLSKLPYLNGVLRETLRVNATIPLFTVEAFEDTLLAGKYPVKEGETIINLLAKSHLDPAVFGEDANEFKPERMMDDNFNRITKEFPNCWKPFGNGMRACIGRPFAWQEALLVMTMLLQNFNFVLDPNYSFGIKQTLTIKPKDMHMRAILRDGLTPTSLERRLAGLAEPEKAPEQAKSDKTAASSSSSSETGKPLTILYGSNSGTCEALAQRVASDAASHGFRATKIDCLDSANGSLPTDQPVVIITASYEGQPPDNAGHFVAWLEGQDKAAAPLKDVSYAVFGCGHKDWVQTFHRIPKLVDATLEQLGASRLADVGLTDASSGEVFSNFESWEDDVLWPALTSKYETTPTKTTTATTTTTTTGADDGSSKKTKGVDVVISNPRTSTLRQDVREATVTNTATLTGSAGEPKSTKKHIEIQIPDDMTYTAGDYLAVLPINPKESVYRAMRRFHLARDAHLSIKTDGPTSLPVDSSVPAHDLLSSYIELSQPATRRNLLALAEYAESEDVKAELSRLATDAYGDEISGKRVSVLDLLERHPSIDLPIGVFLSMMPPMRVRQYSISSSPMATPNKVTLTFSVLNEPSLSGQGPYIGVASSYLDSLAEGDSLHVAIRPSHAAFSLPTDAERTPMVCVAAGTGLAPFRGFIQERAAMIEAGRALAPALLFFGCRSPEHDDLYRAELDKWEALGAVSVRRAYSREPEKSEGCRHVQDRMWRDREELVDLWKRGAKAYVCGSRAVAESAKETIIKIKVEMEKAKGVDADEGDVKDWFEALRNIRYVTDVFD
ncbi:Cytochrome P450 [Colletotrichum higginsianum IMI 349063]|uniref:Bifunctional cytochrome P450/NADPH--P450 reductase n=2 Tax=Colletotrichum higginsianum TaxID=80884 RepID=A0A1B7YLZ9_COLHI|nr:Cytochrome P450 [Colletotrichum higginsianum IMI 349063]OBR12934.1 Cytochrome P450 [Colletotrichum higginsianum IMI 349063]TIC99605.1 Bifunctional cytochrome P450/NADPH--P450 reductase [Colletotrichum higginsianum]